MRAWQLDGPDDSLLTVEAVCSLFNLHRSTLTRMIKQGRFPRGKEIAGKTCWLGSDIACYLHLADRWFPDPDLLKIDAKKPLEDNKTEES